MKDTDRPARPTPRHPDGLVPLVASGSAAGSGVPALAGYTLAVVTDRRHHPLADQLEADGARIVSVQAVRTVAQPEPAALTRAAMAAVAAPADEVVISSAFGFRIWATAAGSLDATDRLLATLAGARLLASEARAADELRTLGFTEIWSTASGTTEDLFSYLQAQPLEQRRVVAQIDGEPIRELTRALMTAGATVVEIPTFRMEPARQREPLRRLADHLARRQVDALVLTSPSCAEVLIDQASRDGILDEMLNAIVEDVACFCLGPLAARPFLDRGLTPQRPARPLLPELSALVRREIPARAITLTVAGQEVQLRGQALVVGQLLIPVQPGPVAVLRVLAQHPGRVMSATEIRRQIVGWSDVDDHAIEMTVSRLRRSLEGTSLDGVGLVQTVMRRGYRLAL